MHDNSRRLSSSSSISSASTDFQVTLPARSVRTSTQTELTSALSTATQSLTAAISRVHRAQAEIDHITHLLSSLSLPSQPSPQPWTSRRSVRVSTPSPELPPRQLPALVSSATSPSLFPNGSFHQGDHVRIWNPRDFQQPVGLVFGISGRFILVRTPNGEIVRRIERNLTLLSRPR